MRVHGRKVNVWVGTAEQATRALLGDSVTRGGMHSPTLHPVCAGDPREGPECPPVSTSISMTPAVTRHLCVCHLRTRISKHGLRVTFCAVAHLGRFQSGHRWWPCVSAVTGILHRRAWLHGECVFSHSPIVTAGRGLGGPVCSCSNASRTPSGRSLVVWVTPGSISMSLTRGPAVGPELVGRLPLKPILGMQTGNRKHREAAFPVPL